MNIFWWTKAIVVVALLLLTQCGLPSTEGKQVRMLPLNAREVYRILRATGREDAVPEGRVVTQGLAAMTGFALGLTKGIGGALLFDIITANVTGLDLGLGGATNGGTATAGTTTQEICFNSRNARSLEEAEAIAEAYSREDKKDESPANVRKSGADRKIKRNRRNKRGRRKGSREGTKRIRHDDTRFGFTKPGFGTATGTATDTADNPIGTATGTTSGTNTVTTDPIIVTTNTNTNAPDTAATQTASPTAAATTTGSGTNVDTGSGTGTSSTSTTSTGNEGAINCIVIQKPK